MKLALLTGSGNHTIQSADGFLAVTTDASIAADLVHRYNTHDAMYAALEAVQALFADDSEFYVARMLGEDSAQDQQRIDATFVQVAAALRAAGEGV